MTCLMLRKRLDKRITFKMLTQRFKLKKHLFTQKITHFALLSISFSTVQGYELFRPTEAEAQPSNSASKINSGKYWIGGVGMALFVKGNQYYYSDENGQTEWRPISRLKYVKDGIVFGEGYYWCQSTMPGAGGMCTPLGWTDPMSDQELSCNYALIAAHSTLFNVKNLNSLNLTPTKVTAYYPDNSTGRPDGYKFLMDGSGGYDILASSKLMERVSSAIITNCPTVSMVSFSAKPEGDVTYGLVNDKVQEFDCYEAYELGQSHNPKPLWGYEACYP